MIHKKCYHRVLETYEKNTKEHIDEFLNSIAIQPLVMVPLIAFRNPNLKTTNRYYDTPFINEMLSIFHSWYRQPLLMRLFQYYAIYSTKILFIILCIILIYIQCLL